MSSAACCITWGWKELRWLRAALVVVLGSRRCQLTFTWRKRDRLAGRWWRGRRQGAERREWQMNHGCVCVCVCVSTCLPFTFCPPVWCSCECWWRVRLWPAEWHPCLGFHKPTISTTFFFPSPSIFQACSYSSYSPWCVSEGRLQLTWSLLFQTSHFCRVSLNGLFCLLNSEFLHLMAII